MSSQSPGGSKSNSDQISTDDDEDKKFVSQAVTFVVGHVRNGFVSLCASVASLLKEQTRLKQEVELLREEFSNKREESTDHNLKIKADVNKHVESSDLLKSEVVSTSHIPKRSIPVSISLSNLPYRKLKGCVCSLCCLNKYESPLAVPLEKGTRIFINGCLEGIVEYVGHVDTLNFPEIQVGIKFDEAIGNSNGKIRQKVYFSVPKNYGMFVSLSNVICIVP